MPDLALLQALKISLMTRGIQISAPAGAELTQGGQVPLTTHEYPTTGGITIHVLGANVFINAPFDEDFCRDPEGVLLFDSAVSSGFFVSFRDQEIPVRVLPLPGFLATVDSKDRPVTDVAYSHADRVRLSPVTGCVYSCAFCDIPGIRYRARPLEQLLEALRIAQADSLLPVHHVLVSGGTPGPRDYAYFDEVCRGIVAAAGMRVDVMMPPRDRDPEFIDRLADMGVHGYAINLELYSNLGGLYVPQKHRLGLNRFAEAIQRAIDRTGGEGRVRSLVVVGLESIEDTLAAVEFLAQLGCDPVLSPFRPAQGSRLTNHPAPAQALLERVYQESIDIVERHGVKLGPRCIPCQHNTLTLPDSSGKYYFSQHQTKVSQ